MPPPSLFPSSSAVSMPALSSHSYGLSCGSIPHASHVGLFPKPLPHAKPIPHGLFPMPLMWVYSPSLWVYCPCRVGLFSLVTRLRRWVYPHLPLAKYIQWPPCRLLCKIYLDLPHIFEPPHTTSTSSTQDVPRPPAHILDANLLSQDAAWLRCPSTIVGCDARGFVPQP